jgi:hypothetical protein
MSTGWKAGATGKRSPSRAWAKIGVPKQELGNEKKNIRRYALRFPDIIS